MTDNHHLFQRRGLKGYSRGRESAGLPPRLRHRSDNRECPRTIDPAREACTCGGPQPAAELAAKVPEVELEPEMRRVQVCPDSNCMSADLMGWTKNTPSGGVPGFKCGHCGLTFIEARVIFVPVEEEYEGVHLI